MGNQIQPRESVVALGLELSIPQSYVYQQFPTTGQSGEGLILLKELQCGS